MKLRALVLLVAALALAACKDGTGPEDVAGVYSLKSVDGAKLPLPLGTDSLGYRYEVSSAYLALAADGVVILAETVRITFRTQSTTDTQALTGSWTASGDEIRMTFPATGDVLLGKLKGSTLTVTVGTSTAIYVR